ncbi:hypothetical protein IWQ60_003982 [Tieghemiomyces parasiticus]|uniref:[histone H3]-lysine(36) N-trimethyltransferase n=1 Tax=Tieghemiomyces parasiticus TaxID=78921 RepID=A0A9W8A9T2_9FUNG|nr:hypothetical protein IWQ60_003982 [Tieghemiomyces parasiticus]
MPGDVLVSSGTHTPDSAASATNTMARTALGQGCDDSPEVWDEAHQTFEPIEDNIYVGNATARATAEEALGCQCSLDSKNNDVSYACGENSDCINRILYIECKRNSCPVANFCQNRRFQKKAYADVKLVKTRLKGFGLAAAADLPRGQFVREYIGEVVSKSQFMKRTQVYEQENIEHHYFMSIRNDEVIDATRRGCIARFVNHSCAPNCEVQKWVVGSRFRMGIFTTKPVPKGTELTFDYKFVRYGADPQRCFCGEPNCKGYIGVMKEPQFGDPGTGEFNLDEEMEFQEVSSRQKAKVHEDDEEYHDPAAPVATAYPGRGLNSPEDVVKFVKVMMEAAGKPNLVLKLLSKLQETNESAYLRKFVRMHGVPLLKSLLTEYTTDDKICVEILRCLARLPIAKRNTIDDHRLTDQLETVRQQNDDATVAELCQELLTRWQSLETVYRIPKVKIARTESGGPSPAPGTSPATDLRSPLGPAGARLTSPKRKHEGWDDHDGDDATYSYDPTDYRRSGGSGSIGRGEKRRPAPDSDYHRFARPRSALGSPYHRVQLDRIKSESSLLRSGGYDSYRGEAGRPTYGSDRRTMDWGSDTRSPAPERRATSPSNTPSPNDVKRTALPPNRRVSSGTDGGNHGSCQDLPLEWRTATAPDGREYYYHTGTGATQWDRPESDLTAEGVSRAKLDALIRNAAQVASSLSQTTPTSAATTKSKDRSARGIPADRTARKNRPASDHSSTTPGSKLKPDPLAATTTPSASRSTISSSALPTPRPPNSNSSPKTLEKELAAKEAVAAMVTKFLSKFKDRVERDEFKRMARKIVQILLEKEYRSPSFTFDKVINMTVAKKTKVRAFVEDYVNKVLTRGGLDAATTNTSDTR